MAPSPAHTQNEQIRAQLEAGKTHDELWNASQLEMVHYGKMHGFMRMYWAKKVCTQEWRFTPVLTAVVLLRCNHWHPVGPGVDDDPQGGAGHADLSQ